MVKPRNDIALHGDQGSLIAAMPAPLQAFLEDTMSRIAQLGDDTESLWAIGHRGLQMEIAGRLVAGRAFQEISARAEKKQIVSDLKMRGIPTTSFYEAIGIYEVFAAFPDVEFVRACAQLDATKLRQVARWSPEERLALASGESVRGITIEQAADMSSREFIAATKPPEVARLEADKELLESRFKKIEAELKVERDKQSTRPVLTEADAWRRDVRIESATVSDAALFHLAELDRLVAHVDTSPHQPRDEDGRRQDKALCTALLLHLRSVAEQALQMFHEAAATLQDRASVDLLDAPTLPGPEADVIWAARERMSSAFHDSKRDREWFRSLFEVQGRGRPVEPSERIKQRLKKG